MSISRITTETQYLRLEANQRSKDRAPNSEEFYVKIEGLSSSPTQIVYLEESDVRLLVSLLDQVKKTCL